VLEVPAQRGADAGRGAGPGEAEPGRLDTLPPRAPSVSGPALNALEPFKALVRLDAPNRH
jgi:hypothetical protein